MNLNKELVQEAIKRGENRFRATKLCNQQARDAKREELRKKHEDDLLWLLANVTNRIEDAVAQGVWKLRVVDIDYNDLKDHWGETAFPVAGSLGEVICDALADAGLTVLCKYEDVDSLSSLSEYLRFYLRRMCFLKRKAWIEVVFRELKSPVPA
jgi:hypothetical protein